MFVVHCKFNHVGFGTIYSIRNLVSAIIVWQSPQCSYHQCHCLHMHGLGEHVHRLDFFNFVAFRF